jgi:chromosome segregation ATPase
MSEDLTKKLPKSDSEKLNEILTTIHNLEGRFDKFEGRFEKLESRVTGIESRLQHLEQTLEQRLHDTRPIWHKVVADIAQLQEGQNALGEAVAEIRITMRDVNRDQIVINDSVRKIQLDFISINERLQRLEVRNRQNSST